MKFLINLKKKTVNTEMKLGRSLSQKNNYWIFPLLLLIGIFAVLFFLNSRTFMVADDYIYSFIFTTKEKIISFSDILQSQQLHYNLWGGRLVAHTLLQTMLMCSPLVIDITNSLVFVIFLVLLSFHIQGRISFPYTSILTLVFFATWIFQPAFSDAVLWITGAVNYLWGMTIILLFLLPYRVFRGKSNSTALILPMFLLGLIAGCMNENTSIAMILMAALFAIPYKKEYNKIPLWAIIGIVGAVVGYMVMLVAPGNFVRAEGVTNEPFVLLYRLLTHTQSLVYYLGGLNLLVFILGVLYVQYGTNKSHIFYSCLIYGVGILASVYAMVLSPSFPPRAWFGPISFNIILMGILFLNLNNSIRLLKRIKYGFIFLGLIVFGFTLYDAVKDVSQIAGIRNAREIEIEKARRTGEPVVIKKSVNTTKFGLGDNLNPYLTNYMSTYYGVTIVDPDEKID